MLGVVDKCHLLLILRYILKCSLDLNLDSIFRHMMKLTTKEKEQWEVTTFDYKWGISYNFISLWIMRSRGWILGNWVFQNRFVWQHVQLILQSSYEDFYKVFLHRFCIWHNYLQVKHDPMNYFLIIPFTFNALILQAAVKNYSCKFPALNCESYFKVVVI